MEHIPTIIASMMFRDKDLIISSIPKSCKQLFDKLINV